MVSDLNSLDNHAEKMVSKITAHKNVDKEYWVWKESEWEIRIPSVFYLL